MTRDEANAAGVAFLDQFIERGAAPDVLAARDHLASGENIGAFDKGEKFAVIGAYSSLREFLRTKHGKLNAVTNHSTYDQPDLVDLLSWTSWEVAGDGAIETTDPAQWSDWLAAVEKVMNPQDK